jgi:hypothetical protein
VHFGAALYTYTLAFPASGSRRGHGNRCCLCWESGEMQRSARTIVDRKRENTGERKIFETRWGELGYDWQ